MVRMLLLGYCFGIRSERRLCEEVHLNLAYRWFCHLGLEDPVPDHSTFSKNRHGRFRESDAFRQLFESVVERSIKEGLVGGEGFAIDARIIRADADRRRGTPSTEPVEWPSPEQRSRAVREYLDAFDAAEPAGAPPRYLSMTDPATRWTAAPGCPAFYAYATNCLVDVRSGVIVDVEATAAHRTEETEATKVMIERVAERHAITRRQLIGDTANGTGPMLEWIVRDKGIEPHVPVWEKTERNDGTFSVTDFRQDEQANECRCPRGEPLRKDWRPFKTPRSHVTQADTIICRSSQRTCASCPLKPRCCPNTPMRKIACSLYEQSRAVARRIADTVADRQSRKDQKKVEVLFAHLKRILKLDRLRPRGRRGARDEFLLAATAQNLRRMAKRAMQMPVIEPIRAT
jgi:IS5 family transposase